MIKKLKKTIFALAIFLTVLINVNAAGSCGAYHYVGQTTANGITGYCIDAGERGSLKTTSSNSQPEELTGAILDWAQSFPTAEMQQIAYRLIAIENGLSHDLSSSINTCIMNGQYEEAEFKTVYESWKQQPNKVVNLGTIENAVLMTVESVDKNESSFTATVRVTANGDNPLTFTSSVGGVNISPSTLTGSGTITVSGPVTKDCSVTVYAIETSKTGGGGVAPSYTPGECVNKSGRVRFFYYPQPGAQSFIVPVPQEAEIPGCEWKPGNIKKGKKNPIKIQMYSGKVEIDTCDADCSADISQNFACGQDKTTTTYLRETKNILGCVVRGKYKDADNCNSSIRKTNNADKEAVLTINGGSQGVNIAESNNYCKVFCIEKIDYKLPGEIKVNNGTYFTMADGTENSNITLEGTRTCYTSKIDNELYARNIKNQQMKVVMAFNLYLKNKAFAENSESLAGFTPHEEKCEVKTCTQQKTESIGANGQKIVTTNDVPSAATSSTTFYTYTKDVTYPKWICDYDSNNGQATCHSTSVTETITAKDQKSGDAQTADCGGTPIYTTCPTVGKTAEEDLKEQHDKFVTEYKANITKAKTLSEKEKQIIGEYKSCYKWNNNYCFNPKIRFEYEDGEIYTDVNNNNYLTGTSAEAKSKKTGDVNVISDDNKTYYGSVNNEYEGAASGLQEVSLNYVYITGESFDLKQAQVDYTNHFMKSESKKSSTFVRSSVRVCTYYPYGTISTGDSCSDEKNRVLLGYRDNRIAADDKGYVFPVTLEKRENRKYNYYLYFENIGVAGNDASCDAAQTNRLMGCKNGTDIYTKYTEKTEDKYKCEYSSCPDCPDECQCNPDDKNCHVEKNGEDTICVFDIPECPDCPVECVGCIWNNNNSTFAYEQVSLTKVFPSEESNTNEATKVGYNWNTDPEVNPNAEKAAETIKEIQTSKEEAYDAKPQYSYVLTPNVMAKIRKYNAAANGEESSNVSGFGEVPAGGYNNDTLTCENGLSCKSSFLDSATMKTVEKARNKNWDNKTYNSAWK